MSVHERGGCLKTKLFAAATAVAFLSLPCFSCRSVPIPTHAGAPVFSMTIDEPKELSYRYVAVYGDWEIIQYDDVWLHSAEYQPNKWSRIWYEGKDIGFSYLEDSLKFHGFESLPDTFNSIAPVPYSSDISVTITANFEGLVKTVTATGFMTLDTLPEPLNWIVSSFSYTVAKPVVTQSFPFPFHS
jgi:hypothetical protein